MSGSMAPPNRTEATNRTSSQRASGGAERGRSTMRYYAPGHVLLYPLLIGMTVAAVGAAYAIVVLYAEDNALIGWLAVAVVLASIASLILEIHRRLASRQE